MKTDKIDVEILADGSLRLSADKISAANHIGAEALLRELIKLAGGTASRSHKHGHSTHTHEHEHEKHGH